MGRSLVLLLQQNNGFTDYIKGYSEENVVNTTTAIRSPLVTIITFLISAVVIIIFSCTFIMTILDLIYIAIPPIRLVLYKGKDVVSNQDSIENQTSKPIIWVSQDMKQLVDNNFFFEEGKPSGSQMMKKYISKRTVSLVFLVICTMVLVTSTIVTDTGINIGMFFYKIFNSLFNGGTL